MRHLAAFVPNRLGISPGQRARIELWSKYLEADGWTITFHSFEDDKLHEVLYGAGRSAAKATRMLACYRRHLKRAVQGVDADVYYLYREAALVGPAIAERLLARRAPPLVYDLDDPTWIRYRSPVNGWLSLLKFPGKTRSLIRLSDRVLTINGLIGEYVGRLNPRVTVVPNLIDTERYRPAPRATEGPVRVAWIGSFSTVGNLHTIAVPLARLQQRTGACVRIIGAGSVELPSVELEVEEWSADTEVASLNQCDIGVVPLSDHPWNRWKFFFKTIQYMALCIPVVARRLGSNPEVVIEGVNGFLVESEAEWLDRLELLARDPCRREEMGAAARATVLERFSLDSQVPRVLQIFDDLADRR